VVVVVVVVELENERAAFRVAYCCLCAHFAALTEAMKLSLSLSFSLSCCRSNTHTPKSHGLLLFDSKFAVPALFVSPSWLTVLVYSNPLPETPEEASSKAYLPQRPPQLRPRPSQQMPPPPPRTPHHPEGRPPWPKEKAGETGGEGV